MTNQMETTGPLAIMLPEDMSEGRTTLSHVIQSQKGLRSWIRLFGDVDTKKLTLYKFVLPPSCRYPSGPAFVTSETSDCPNLGGKQTFLD